MIFDKNPRDEYIIEAKNSILECLIWQSIGLL